MTIKIKKPIASIVGLTQNKATKVFTNELQRWFHIPIIPLSIGTKTLTKKIGIIVPHEKSILTPGAIIIRSTAAIEIVFGRESFPNLPIRLKTQIERLHTLTFNHKKVSWRIKSYSVIEPLMHLIKQLSYTDIDESSYAIDEKLKHHLFTVIFSAAAETIRTGNPWLQKQIPSFVN